MPIDPGSDGDIDAAVRKNLAAVQSSIRSAAESAGRSPSDVSLVAVSKSQPVSRVRAALLAGHRTFGENRIQEAIDRWTPLREEAPDVELHFVGHLQSNKAADAVASFDVIQSIDRPKVAQAIAKAMDRQDKRPDCMVQVNTGEEAQKGGVLPMSAERLVSQCRDELGLPISGLMCIPPFDDDPSPHFALLAEMAERFGLPQISMGMSADYELAIRLGATHVRVGTAIFGTRLPRS